MPWIFTVRLDATLSSRDLTQLLLLSSDFAATAGGGALPVVDAGVDGGAVGFGLGSEVQCLTMHLMFCSVISTAWLCRAIHGMCTRSERINPLTN